MAQCIIIDGYWPFQALIGTLEAFPWPQICVGNGVSEKLGTQKTPPTLLLAGYEHTCILSISTFFSFFALYEPKLKMSRMPADSWQVSNSNLILEYSPKCHVELQNCTPPDAKNQRIRSVVYLWVEQTQNRSRLRHNGRPKSAHGWPIPVALQTATG